MIKDWFAIRTGLQETFQLRSLIDMQWLGDKRMPEFLDNWNKVVHGLAHKPSENDLCELLLEKVRQPMS